MRGLDDAKCRTFVWCLHHERQTQALDHSRDAPLIAQYSIVRRRKTCFKPDSLSHDFVHRETGCHGSATGIREPQQLESTLDCSVLTESTVQGNEYSIKFSVAQFP